jgi:hypothetical protein
VSPMRVRAVVSRLAADRWTADLVLRSGGDEHARSLEGPTCESVSEASALVIALAIHSAALAPRPVASAPASNDAQRDRASGAPHEDRSRGPLVAAAIIGDIGSLPGPDFGGEIAVGLPLFGIRWEPFVAYFATKSGTVDTYNSMGADFALAVAGLRGCYPLVRGAIGLFPCAGGGLEWIRADGFGSRVPGHASSLGGTLRVGAIVSHALSDIVAPRVELEAVVPLWRPEFVVNGAGTVYIEPRVAIRGALGLELHF